MSAKQAINDKLQGTSQWRNDGVAAASSDGGGALVEWWRKPPTVLFYFKSEGRGPDLRK